MQHWLTACCSSYFAQAMENYDKKRFHAAADLFKQAIKQNPADAKAYFYFAKTLEELKERDAAKAMYETCFNLDPFSAQGRQAKEALMKLINKQITIEHPYEDPQTVRDTIRTIDSQTASLKRYKSTGNSNRFRAQNNANFSRSRNINYNWPSGEISDLNYINSHHRISNQRAYVLNSLLEQRKTERAIDESREYLINSMAEQAKLNKPKIKAAGTNLYIRNYDYSDYDEIIPQDPPIELHATQGQLFSKNAKSATNFDTVVDSIKSWDFFK